MKRILRVSARGELVSADAFEKLFQQHIGACFNVESRSSRSFFADLRELAGGSAALLANPEIKRFIKEKVGIYDFFSPGFGAFLTTPFFLESRNSQALKTRLLLIAHAPGTQILEWVLIAPLLRPGDLIIAPSQNAADEIALLSPRLSLFVTVIPHPIHTLPLPKKLSFGTDKRFISLSRLHTSKLIHRQIEALARLRERGGFDVNMDIAGPPQDSSGQELTYVRSLVSLIKRVGLERHIKLQGEICGDQNKADFFAQAHALINLSVSLEESFGKSIVEALGSGLPVICTRWNGFLETAGSAGLFVPVTFTDRGNPDVKVSDLAATMEKSLLVQPAVEICHRQAQRSLPTKIAARYKQVLEHALTQPNPADSETGKVPRAFDRQGLLGTVALLQVFSFTEIFTCYLDYLYREIENYTDGPVAANEFCPGALMHEILVASTSRPLTFFLGHSLDPVSSQRGKHLPEKQKKISGGDVLPVADDFFSRLGDCTKTQTERRSQEICLLYCAVNRQLQPLKSGLKRLTKQGDSSNNLNYLEAELACLENRFSDAYALALQNLQNESLTEFDSLKLRQLARITRKAGTPEKVLPHLSAWLKRFPDSSDSGVVWLDLCVNAFSGGTKHLATARKAFKESYKLLGNIPALQKLSQKLFINCNYIS